MKDSPIFIDYNNISAMHLKKGDKVKCIRSTVPGREGTIYTIILGYGSHKQTAKGKAGIEWLKHCSSYGDRFEKIIDPL